MPFNIATEAVDYWVKYQSEKRRFSYIKSVRSSGIFLSFRNVYICKICAEQIQHVNKF